MMRFITNIGAVAALLVLSGCDGQASDAETGETRAAVSVVWRNPVGVAVRGNELVKTSPRVTWQAGAASTAEPDGDGYVELTTGENDTAKMVGLSYRDGDQTYADIDFAVYLRATGHVGVVEGGVERGGDFGSYAPGDVFRVESRRGKVTYARNGVVFYTSAATPRRPLLVDTSLRDPGATIDDVIVVSTAVDWMNAVGVRVAGDRLTKTAAENTWQAGASSRTTICGDGYVEFTTAEATTAKMAGLSHGDASTGFADIDFAILLAAHGQVGVFEAGVAVELDAGTYAAGDVFRVENDGGEVTYSKNGAVFHTSEVPPTLPLRLDTSLRTPGATIRGATVADRAEVCPPRAAVRLGRIDPPELSAWGVLGIAFDAAQPIVIDGTGRTMWRIDPETAGVLETFPMDAPAVFTQGLAFDSRHLFTVRDNRLATVDPASGEVVLAPRTMLRFNFLSLAVDPPTGDLWMLNDCWNPSCSTIGGTQLWRIDKATGRATLARNFSPLGLGQAMSLAITADGTFHAGVCDVHGVTKIWALDPVTGSARLETRTGLSGLLIGLALDPSDHHLVGIEELGQRYFLVEF